jgi:hypothetical protein
MVFPTEYGICPWELHHIGFHLYILLSLFQPEHCLVIVSWCPFCSHETLYGLGCAVVFNSNFSTVSLDTRLSVLPLLMISLHTFSLVFQDVLTRLFLCTGFSISASSFKRTFLNIRDDPSSAPSASTSLHCASEM